MKKKYYILWYNGWHLTSNPPYRAYQNGWDNYWLAYARWLKMKDLDYLKGCKSLEEDPINNGKMVYF